MAQFPALDIFTDSWLADTANLPRVDRDIYFHLLILIWRSPSCRIPAELDWAARKLRCSTPETEILKSVMSEFCQTDGNWVTQKRLTKEYKLALERSRKQSDRAKSRWHNDKVVCRGNAPTATATATVTVTVEKKNTTYSSKEGKGYGKNSRRGSISNSFGAVSEKLDRLFQGASEICAADGVVDLVEIS